MPPIFAFLEAGKEVIIRIITYFYYKLNGCMLYSLILSNKTLSYVLFSPFGALRHSFYEGTSRAFDLIEDSFGFGVLALS